MRYCSSRGLFTKMILVFRATFWLPLCLFSLAPWSSITRGCTSISHNSLLSRLTPTPLPILSWHRTDLRPEGSKRDREDWSKLEWGRKHERRGVGERKRKQGRGVREKKTAQSEAMIWLLVLSSGEGKEERNDMERAREKWEGKEEVVLGLRVVCHPCGSFSHSFTFSTPSAHTQNRNLPN